MPQLAGSSDSRGACLVDKCPKVGEVKRIGAGSFVCPFLVSVAPVCAVAPGKGHLDDYDGYDGYTMARSRAATGSHSAAPRRLLKLPAARSNGDDDTTLRPRRARSHMRTHHHTMPVNFTKPSWCLKREKPKHQHWCR